MTNEFYNLGVAYFQNKHYDEAIENFKKALQADPGLIHAYNYIGNAFQEKQQFDRAIAYYERAIRVNPADPTAYINIGIACQNTGNYEKAIEYFKKTLNLNPSVEQVYDYIGFALTDQGKLQEALENYRALFQRNHNSVTALIRIGSILKQQGKINESEDSLRAAVKIQPDNPVPWQSLLVGMLYNPRHDAQTIYAEHLQFAKRFTESLLSQNIHHNNERIPSRRLRIGYISPDFKKHSVSYFIEPILAAHDRKNVEVFCFSDVTDQDAVTARMQGYADTWRDIAGLPDEDVAGLIRSDAIDILVDLAGHTAGNRLRLFTRQPAPVQVSWIGYPATTGLSSMDYKIVDAYTDPPGMTERYYTEKLIRMPESFLCYLPDKDSPEVGPLPALSSGHITFGSFNNFAKVTPEVMGLWARILKAVPHARMILKGNSLSDRATKAYVMDTFSRNGISGERLELLGWEKSAKAHLQLYNRVDIAMDTFPYNGTTTTCDALWMGVPVVSLAGNTHTSRVGVSILTNAGLPELIAQTPDAYVDNAVRMAADFEQLRLLRMGLREMIACSPLTNAGQFTAQLEICFRTIWQNWCTSFQGERS